MHRNGIYDLAPMGTLAMAACPPIMPINVLNGEACSIDSISCHNDCSLFQTGDVDFQKFA